ncbi:MAG: DUF4290 domain-containing protein [Saprospiraceae bacterium]|nr:DUF4290 domain-containing protein [Saprospiraceae bacterium]
MNRIDIEYNTEKPDLLYPEYGRTIHELLQYATTIEEPRKQQKTVEAIIGLMQQLGPGGNRNMDDYRERVWNHAFAIADYKLHATPPPGITIRREGGPPPVITIEYPPTALRFRHYGNGIQALMQKAIAMPEGIKKEGFVEVIASYMKLAYKTWNKEHYVSDDIVKEDLEILSDGKLALHEGHDSLDKLAAGAGRHDKERPRQNNQRNQNRQGQSGNNRNRKQRSTNYGSNSGNVGGNFKKRKK